MNSAVNSREQSSYATFHSWFQESYAENWSAFGQGLIIFHWAYLNIKLN